MNHFTQLHPLSETAKTIFDEKGGGNAVKVRRIAQLTQDFTDKPISETKILDLGCGEGVYSIEAGFHGASVLGIDGRDDRLKYGKKAAEEMGLSNVRFSVEDARKVTLNTHGSFDVIYFLGLLYHLDVPDSILLMQNLYSMCTNFMIIDTRISLQPNTSYTFNNITYEGEVTAEHNPNDDQATRAKRLLMSIDNDNAFVFTRKSLCRLLNDLGFTNILECHVPNESNQPNDRLTLIAFKRQKAKISSYPWINDLTEYEIDSKLKETFIIRNAMPIKNDQTPQEHPIKKALNAVFGLVNLEVIRKRS
jgi:SAM-dependent methyltransferase